MRQPMTKSMHTRAVAFPDGNTHYQHIIHGTYRIHMTFFPLTVTASDCIHNCDTNATGQCQLLLDRRRTNQRYLCNQKILFADAGSYDMLRKQFILSTALHKEPWLNQRCLADNKSRSKPLSEKVV